MKKNKIIIFYDYFLPAYKAGGPIQSIANLLNQFQENITYKIVCSNKDVDGTILNVECNKWIKYNSISDVFFCDGKTSILLIKKELKSFHTDIFFINGIYSWKYNLIPLFFYKAKRKILSVRGMLHPGALSQKTFKKKLYINLLKHEIHTFYEF